MGEQAILKPQFICISCKTVIGQIWDDDENTCECVDVYDIEVWQMCSVEQIATLKEHNATLKAHLASAKEVVEDIHDLVKGYNPDYEPTIDDLHRITEWFTVINKVQALTAHAKLTKGEVPDE